MNWKLISERVLDGSTITPAEALAILESPDEVLLEVLQGAYRIRKKHFGNTVSLHLLRNVKSGKCPEDCAFCSQSTSAINDVERYDMQTVESIVEGAQAAVDRQAKRYCVVSSTRAPNPSELETICEAAIQIKQKHPGLEICSSLGLLTEEKARKLKEAGVNRFNHNLETVERLTPLVRSRARYRRSLSVLGKAHAMVPDGRVSTKSGIMLGLGEREEEVVQVFDDLLAHQVTVLTMGQYLRPTVKHLPVVEYVRPEKFEEFKRIAEEKGFRHVASGPLVRSSYRAADFKPESGRRKA